MAKFPGAAGAMKAQSETLLGVFSTFKDTISIALSDAFQPVIPQIKDTLKEITPIIGQAVKVLAPSLGQLLTALGPLLASGLSLAAPILGKIVDILSILLTTLEPAFGPLADAFNQILTALTPLIVVLVGVAEPALVGEAEPGRGQPGGLVERVALPLVPAVAERVEDVVCQQVHRLGRARRALHRAGQHDAADLDHAVRRVDPHQRGDALGTAAAWADREGHLGRVGQEAGDDRVHRGRRGRHPGDPVGPQRGVLGPAEGVVQSRRVLVLEPAHRHVPPGQHHRHRRGHRLPVDGLPDRLPVLVRPRHASSSRTALMPRSTSSYDVDNGDRPTRRPPGSR